MVEEHTPASDDLVEAVESAGGNEVVAEQEQEVFPTDYSRLFDLTNPSPAEHCAS